MDSYIVRTFMSFGLILVGAASWIVAERLQVVDPTCLITQELVDATTQKK